MSYVNLPSFLPMAQHGRIKYEKTVEVENLLGDGERWVALWKPG